MPENDFEFSLPNGDKVFTGMRVPETRPLMFAESTAEPFTLDEAYDLISNPKRKPAREVYTYMLNQGRRSSCNGYAATRALMTARHRAGLEFVDLAPEYVYALINGGRDQGSLLPDGMRAICEAGAPPRDMVPHESYRIGDMSIEAKRVAKNYRAFECEQMPTDSPERHWAMMVSEVLRGHPLVTAVHVGNRFMKIDGRGVAGVDRGAGNHAVTVDGVKLLSGRPQSWSDFVLDMPNSWGTGYGDNGRAYLTIHHSVEPIRWHATYSVRSVLDDPDAENPYVKG